MEAGERRESSAGDRNADGSVAAVQFWIGLLWRHAWAMLAVFVVVSAGGYWYTMQQPNVYQASATVLVSPEGDQVRALSPFGDGAAPQGSSFMANRIQFAMQEHLLRSPELLDEVAERLSLRSSPSFLGLFGDEATPDAIVERSAVANPAIMLRGMLRVNADDERRVVQITMSSRDPVLAADVVNAVAEAHVERNLLRQLEATDQALDWLMEQSASLRSSLENAELAQLDYLRDQGTLSVALDDRRNLSVRAVEELSTQLANARLEVDRLGSVVRQIRTYDSLDDLLAANIPEILDNSMIQSFKGQLVALDERDLELRERYGELWPERRAVLARREMLENVLEREIQNVLRSYVQRFETAQLLERTVAERLSSAQRDVLRSGENEIAFNALRREAETNRELFGVMERRLKEIELHRMLQHNNLSVLESAVVPVVPVRPRRAVYFLATLLLAGVLSLGTALALEFLDQSVKPDTDFDREFGLGLLGMLPEISAGKGRRGSSRGPAKGQEFNPDIFVHSFPRSGMAEACRSIRTNLLFMDREDTLKRMLVTSSGPREGKTLTSVSLATVFAQSGNRTVLVDADMRKPRLGRVFGVDDAGRGLVNVLVGECTLDEALVETEVPGLFLLPCGSVPPNPVEILHSVAFGRLQDELDERFDRVLFDTPPVGPVTDARVLSGRVGGVVLVARASHTNKDAFARAIDDLDAVKANLLGIVLNSVNFEKRSTGGGYYRYYYQQYNQYYGDAEESASS
ncbi:MAG: polysaccharide biosynthesis tyrosine autokinase [Deltaproteobacteria bacterium]|nr:MAG: polysaccharide biosynthesis tyrosine autokinase [Deltaproteobacteria bacterium]